MISFNIVLITVLISTFLVTILFHCLKPSWQFSSTMNTKSGTNGISLHRIKRGITLDLQKQKIWFKEQQKEHLFRIEMISNIVWKNSYVKKNIFWLYHFHTDCSKNIDISEVQKMIQYHTMKLSLCFLMHINYFIYTIILVHVV